MHRRASTVASQITGIAGAPGVVEGVAWEGAVQCGFCIPGMLMAAHALLADNPHPTAEEVSEGLAGNLCRCAGYGQIVRAVLAAGDDAA